MLGNVAPTPFDLNFSLFGIPVRIHPLFWLVSALLGWNARDPRMMVIWVVCVFVSILIHELGHALTAQSYGWPPHIVLYSFGGYASFQPSWGYTTGRAILILIAGPGAGFVLYGVVRAVEYLLIHQDIEIPYYALVAIDDMEFINLWWGLVNLLPVYPLDGGQISREALTWWRPHDGFDISLKISLVVAAAAAYWLFTHGMTFNALLFASLAFENLQMLQHAVGTGNHRVLGIHLRTIPAYPSRSRWPLVPEQTASPASPPKSVTSRRTPNSLAPAAVFASLSA